MSVTAYTVLGVAPDATQEQIAKAFRDRCAECHPDRATDDADRAARAAKMSKLTLAKRYVGEPEARTKYDLKLRDMASKTEPPAAHVAPDDVGIDDFLARLRSGNIGVEITNLGRQYGLVDQPGFARIQAAADKGAEVAKGVVDLVGLVRGR